MNYDTYRIVYIRDDRLTAPPPPDKQNPKLPRARVDASFMTLLLLAACGGGGSGKLQDKGMFYNLGAQPEGIDRTGEFNAGSGNDVVIGTEDDNDIRLGAGNDIVFGVGGNNTLHGEDGNDRLNDGYGDDKLYGGAGNDRLETDFGENYLYGGDGDDLFESDGTKDKLFGGDGNDVLVVVAYKGPAEATGGAGSDFFYIRHAFHTGVPQAFIKDFNPEEDSFWLPSDFRFDRIEDGNAYFRLTNSPEGIDEDEAYTDANSYDAVIFEGDYTEADFERSSGQTATSGNDFIELDNTGNIFRASTGNDYVEGKGGDDTLYGDAGNDTLIGGAGSDTLYGGDGIDILSGGGPSGSYQEGADTLYGGAGIDLLEGESGLDTLTGGTGEDYFLFSVDDIETGVFDTETFTYITEINIIENRKTITDFEVEDKIVFYENEDEENFNLEQIAVRQSGGNTYIDYQGTQFIEMTGFTGDFAVSNILVDVF